MEQEGVDLSDHRPRDVAELSLGEFDWVISLDSHVDRYLKECCEIDGNKLITWDIHDPYGQDIDAYRTCLQSIRSHLRDLLAQLGLPSGEDGKK
jgi:protein-tyrosine-phosphatase